MSKYYNKQKANERKLASVLARGGKCECCETTFITMGSAHFHHIQSDTKKCNMASMWNSRSDKAIALELAKCMLLCSNCHDNLHNLKGENVSTNDTYAFVQFVREQMGL